MVRAMSRLCHFQSYLSYSLSIHSQYDLVTFCLQLLYWSFCLFITRCSFMNWKALTQFSHPTDSVYIGLRLSGKFIQDEIYIQIFSFRKCIVNFLRHYYAENNLLNYILEYFKYQEHDSKCPHVRRIIQPQQWAPYGAQIQWRPHLGYVYRIIL